jgi:hypothetical protein
MCANCDRLRDELVFVQQRYLALLAAAQDDSPQPVALSVKVSEYQRLAQALAEAKAANAELLRGVREHRTDKNVIARLERELAQAQAECERLRDCFQQEVRKVQLDLMPQLTEAAEMLTEEQQRHREAQKALIIANTTAMNLHSVIAARDDEIRALKAQLAEAQWWQREVAEGLGYLNQSDGQSGYEVADAPTIVGAWRNLLAEVVTLSDQLAEAQRERSEWQQKFFAEQAECVKFAQAFNELEARRCGNCADWATEAWQGTDRGYCDSKTSACRIGAWPADHGCPHWRAKEGQ